VLIVYDLQFHYLTPDEQSYFRKLFLANVEDAYVFATTENHWSLHRRSVNNWTFGDYFGARYHRFFYAGLMFHEDPRSSDYVTKGLEIFDWFYETFPNNGVWNPETNEYEPYPTKNDGALYLVF